MNKIFIISLILFISLFTVEYLFSSCCEQPDNGSGTITLPPMGCDYVDWIEDYIISDGLPPGTTLVLHGTLTDYVCTSMVCSLPIPPGICEVAGGSLGGNGHCFESTLIFDVTGTGALTGFSRTLLVPVSCEIHTGPRNPGDPVQDFPGDFFRLQGQLFGDPDFCTFIIMGGTDYGLPSPGQTVLTQLPSGDFAVDSFFDITYMIDYEGCPGSILDGYSGSQINTLRMELCQPGSEITAASDYYDVPIEPESFFDVSSTPIPPDFFGPGSDPFDGVITMTGANPLFDTELERQDDLYLPEPYPSSDEIPLEMKSLDLVSTEPITVTSIGGDTQWDVDVHLSGEPVETGTLDATKTSSNGGTFTSDFYVLPVFTFTKVGEPSETRTWDWGLDGIPPLLFVADESYTWEHSPMMNDFNTYGVNPGTWTSSSGSQLSFNYFPLRQDYFDAVMGIDNELLSGGGSGYNGGEWYFYPNTNWWNIWFYDHPYDPDRYKHIETTFLLGPAGPNAYAEIVFNWSTPYWSDLGNPFPVLPEWVPDLPTEELYIVRSETIFSGDIFTDEYIVVTFDIEEYNPEWLSIDIMGSNFRIEEGYIEHTCMPPVENGYEWEYGDAPEGSVAYPTLSITGAFPTCIGVPLAGYIQHGLCWAHFGPMGDFESDGNAGNCPIFTPYLYDQDECFNDGDAGLQFPASYTITGPAGSEYIISCDISQGPLGYTCQTASWGSNLDMYVENLMPVDGYMNVLIDWNQNGSWGGYSLCASTPVPEHVLVDFPIPMGYTGLVSALYPPSFLIGPNTGYVWSRFSITEIPVFSDWNGEGIFEDGETEDYLLLIEQEPEELDYGDAPDPSYPTLSASNGAAHILDGSTYLGAGVDSEPDGLQDPNALGDDYLDGNDDEDGVVFNRSFAPGHNVQITVTASTSGSLNSWFDFNQNGTWLDAGEQIHNNLPLTAGLNILNFPVPPSAAFGYTFARFRFTSYPVSSPSPLGIETDGEVEDYRIFINDQFYNIKMDNPQYPELSGCDINISYPNVIADDWLCNESGGVTDLHFWISYLSDDIPFSHPSRGIELIHVSIHADIPADPPDQPYSLPEPAPLWERDFNSTDFTLSLYFENLQSWFTPPDLFLQENHNLCYLVDIPVIPDPFIQMAGTIYWLDISIIMAPGYEWATPGWKTTADNWNDTAVYGTLPDGIWEPLLYPTIIEDIDLAFIITGVTEELDYGDAPDPSYPTKWINDGARHAIDGTTYLGSLIDAEPDGQPDPNSLGDDNDGTDDEDGVTFPTMFAGSQVLVDVTVAGGGYLDVWIDFNIDGDWLDANEQVYAAYLATGTHQIPVNIPSGAVIGLTHSRFRISTGGGLSPTGYAADGEVEDYEIEIIEPIPEIKWEQPPDLTPLGIDVDATWDEPTIMPPHILADDFLCTTPGLITDIHVWGSWKYDMLPGGDPNNVLFTLSIHSDIPDPDGAGPEYSMPGDVLWIMDFDPSMFYVDLFYVSLEGWYDPATGEYFPDGDTQCWFYNFYIPEELAFLQEGTPENPVVYWLDLQAHTMAPEYRFGWKTSEIHWNDDGVWGIGYEPYPGPWDELRYPEMHPFAGESIDLAFRITTTPSAEELDYGDAPDPTYPTWLASDGARHPLDGVTYLGAGIDSELDGQPDPNSLGDDNDGSDDEDGITFPTLYTGQQVLISAIVAGGGYIDAWFDFNGNGSWYDTGESISTAFLPAGTHQIPVYIPGYAAIGYTHCRFRLSTTGGLNPTGIAPDGEVEDYEIEIVESPSEIKWQQFPELTPLGMNVCTSNDPYTQSRILADDFLCNSPGLITDIHIWGSFKYDLIPYDDPTSLWFDLSIHEDIPDPDGAGPLYSQPGEMLWLMGFPPGTYSAELFSVNLEGWYDPITGEYLPEGDTECWLFHFYINGIEAFLQEGTPENPVVFWLDVHANTDISEHEFGWKTSEMHWNDDGVFTPGTEPYSGDWNELRYPAGHPLAGNSIDMAFMITTNAPGDELDFGDNPDLNYKTLLSNDGARHFINGVTYMGAGVDSEADGQPDASALGDDYDGNDDEDGIFFLTPIIPGVINQIMVDVSSAGYFSGWLDYNLDNDFDDPGEYILQDIILTQGISTLGWPSLNTGSSGYSYARFRFSTQPALNYYGLADDGEVEDYRIMVDEGIDNPKWQQIPEYNMQSEYPYCFWGWNELSIYGLGPIMADDWLCEGPSPVTDIHWWGSYHEWNPEIPPTIVPVAFHLGIWTDVPAGGDPPFSHPDMMIWENFVNYEDTNEHWVGYDYHPEYVSVPDACFRYDYQIPQGMWFYQEGEGNIYWLSIAAVYDEIPAYNLWGWKTRPYYFNDDAVRIFDPFLPVPGSTFLLGEPVEDGMGNSWDLAFILTSQEITDSLDYGDAPDPTYPTLAINNGASHTIVPAEYLGSSIDAESDGQPTANADGDDNDGNDDEDGIAFLMPLMPGNNTQVAITASLSGYIHAWIDFNRDGDWDEASEHVLVNATLPSGVTQYNFPVPITAMPGNTIARFRYITTSTPSLPYNGNVYGGEVEDYLVLIDSLDYGDAPETGTSYPTIRANNGARHKILSGYHLGNQPNSIDYENNGQPDPLALGDDNDGNDDEDGIVLSTLIPGQDAVLDVTTSMSVMGYNVGWLSAWIDYNADGDWDDPGEIIANGLGLSPLGHDSFFIPVPATASPNTYTYARFRFCSTGGVGYNGFAPDGEVEDYRVFIGESLGESKIINPQFPDASPMGVDVYAEEPLMLADDFQCIQTGSITDIHIWASWLDDLISDTGNIALTIWSDIPDPDGPGPLYSMPGELLWSQVFSPGQYEQVLAMELLDGEWWFDPNTLDTSFPADYLIWRYHFSIPVDISFFQFSYTIYWLGVQMLDLGDMENLYKFGWKTSFVHWNDGAVWALMPFRDITWNPLLYPDSHPQYPQPVDLSFFISGIEDVPVPLNIRIIRQTDRIKIEWDAVSGAVSYNVYYATDPYAVFPAGWTFLGNTSDLFYYDGPPLPTGPKKFYRITSVN